ncbi:MAG: aspartate ammonia-lyase [Verrucomicrobia bacterium]|nr:aspartate ammonia-lyase [Verrucomicrobiota bacterium]
MKTRIERDTLGERRVPATALYGIQTLRAVENFPVSGRCLHPAMIRAFAQIKRAAAIANRRCGALDSRRARAIERACGELLEGQHDRHFVVDAFQAGAGTSFNMNVNEVLANRALELLGHRRGDYERVHPNDHVNMGQSTNDTFPTALHVAALSLAAPLFVATRGLARALAAKGRQFRHIVKSARTHLMDAVPITLGKEFTAYASAVARAADGIEAALDDLRELPLGGTVVGTGVASARGFRREAVRTLASLTGLKLRAARDPIEAVNSRYAVGRLSGAVRSLALELIRIANDLRLLGSGPTTGFNEIQLPAVQPGSSIMPAKVNPVMAECLDMICFQVVGNDTAVALAVQAGQLSLNVMMPLMAGALLDSMQMLINYLPVFSQRYVSGIRANTAVCRHHFEINPTVATALNPLLGYARVADLVKESLATGRSVRELVLERRLMTRGQCDRLFSKKSLRLA